MWNLFRHHHVRTAQLSLEYGLTQSIIGVLQFPLTPADRRNRPTTLDGAPRRAFVGAKAPRPPRTGRAQPGKKCGLVGTLVRSHEADPEREQRHFDAVAQSELLEDVRQVALHRRLADAQPLGDLGVA